MNHYERIKQAGEVVEVTEDEYWESLEVLPPIYIKGVSWFAVSEAYSHNGKGEPIYHCFAQIAGKYYGTIGTTEEARIAFIRKMNKERLFVGVFPAGIVYADRCHEVNNDYKRLAFLPYSTLELQLEADCPPCLIHQIQEDAASYKAGEQFSVSASGQTVMLGSGV